MRSIVSKRFVKCHDSLKSGNTIRSSRQFAMSLDYLPQSLNEILKGKRDVTIELLRKAIEVYHFNPTYIFTGRGPMFTEALGEDDFRTLTVIKEKHKTEQIVYVPAEAQETYAKEQVKADFVSSLPTFSMPDYKYSQGTHRAFQVTGDSMEPTLFEGDKVLCSFQAPLLWEEIIKNDYVYVIVTRGDILIRRIKNELKSSSQLRLFADNNFYTQQVIPREDIRELWYVRAKISPFLPSPKNINTFIREEVQSLSKIIQEHSRIIEEMNHNFSSKF